ncbi:MAG: hypothetical protein ACP5G0_13825, partial [Desulfomonilia bacterium]
VLGSIGEILEQSQDVRGRFLELLGHLDSAVQKGYAFSQEFVFSLFFWPWAHHVIHAREKRHGDRIQFLNDEVLSSGMTITLPKALRSHCIQTVFILEHMIVASRTGRMRWSLKKRARYRDASRLFALVTDGRWSPHEDPFGSFFREKFKTTPGKKRRRRFPRYGKKPGKISSP